MCQSRVFKGTWNTLTLFAIVSNVYPRTMALQCIVGCGSKREKEGNYSKLSRWCRRASSQLCAAASARTGSEPNWGCLLLPTSSSRSTNTGCILRSLLGFWGSSGTKLGLPLITLQHQGAFWETPNGAKLNQESQMVQSGTKKSNDICF